jgi:hypothetical protein
MTTETEIYYNVWNFNTNCWVANNIVFVLEYPPARTLLERYRAKHQSPNSIQIRALEANGPGEVVGYNVWCKATSSRANGPRWTNAAGCVDRDHNPRPLTWEEALRIWVDVFDSDLSKATIQEIGNDYLPRNVYRYQGEVKLAEVDPIEMPKPAPTHAPTEAAIDFAAYCGFKKVPLKSWTVERDPYTGLPKVKL